MYEINRCQCAMFKLSDRVHMINFVIIKQCVAFLHTIISVWAWDNKIILLFGSLSHTITQNISSQFSCLIRFCFLILIHEKESHGAFTKMNDHMKISTKQLNYTYFMLFIGNNYHLSITIAPSSSEFIMFHQNESTSIGFI